MDDFQVRVVNKIAPEGLALLGDNFSVGAEQADPHAILVRSSPVDTDQYPSLLAVARAGAGVNNITVDKASGRGICVFNTPGANANAVAELVFVMLGIQARNLHQGMDFCQGLKGQADSEIGGQVEARKSAFKGFELAGKTLGVLGLGKIGVRVANGGGLRQMRVIGFDPFPALENIHNLSPEVILARSLGEMVRHADILTVHTPLNEKTIGVVDRDLLNRLPAGAILVNYARGPIVDEAAVLAALDSGQLSAYLTDFPTKATLAHPKIIVTPHLGASTEESEEQCACMAVSELKAYLEYGIITHSVNFPTAESLPSDKVHTRFIMINRDVPDMIGFASHAIGASGVNIVSYLNESNGSIGYNIIDLQSELAPEVVAAIEAHPNVIRTRSIRFVDS
ncbi:MAG: 3-phosphoglycerate dehydrogenase family protein [Desulfobulbaceae bacterium]|nr:3-phosphoglycerate dehydrogenase family protein [Desulfobulbaceae bacterium]HIJ78696.1 3-phosphoglycerate dehydrogenase [Deltaproteobacteria bacterium]